MVTLAETSDSLCEKAIDIIHNTQDGDLLSPSHLKLTELAVNGFLTEKGIDAFYKLHQKVMSGKYKQPFLHGVEHMTQDHEGYILFKDKTVEHYDFDWVHSLDAKNVLFQLQQSCLFLESKGIEPSMATAAWGWDNYKDEYGEYEKFELDALLSGSDTKIIFTRATLFDYAYSITNIYLPGRANESAIKETEQYIDFVKDHGDKLKVDICPCSYGLGTERNATDKELTLILCCFDYLRDKGFICEETPYKDITPCFKQEDVELEDEYDEEI